MNRRRLLSLALTPLADAVLAACGKTGFAEGHAAHKVGP